MGKLVRDRIPVIIRNSGKEADIYRISGEELRKALKEKLVEESLELKETDDIAGELVDVMEVIDAIIESYNIDRDSLELLKLEKYKERGGFKEGFMLRE